MTSRHNLIVAGLVVVVIGLIIASIMTKNAWPGIVAIIVIATIPFVNMFNQASVAISYDNGPSVVQYEDVIDNSTSEFISGGGTKLTYIKTERGNGDPRYITKEENENKEPVITIDLPPGKNVTKLGFVRTTGVYTLPILIAEFIAWSKENTPDNSIELQDDAMFTIKVPDKESPDKTVDCKYAAVLYRLLTQTGDPSIYTKYGFQPILSSAVVKIRPMEYTRSIYEEDIKMVRSSPASHWTKIKEYCAQIKRAHVALEEPVDGESLKGFLMRHPCDKQSDAFRDIDTLANRTVNGGVKVDDPVVLEFLISFYRARYVQNFMRLV